MIDVGIITGSGIYEMPGDTETSLVENRFGEAKVAVFGVGPWTVGAIPRHGRGHHHLPHTVPHRANLVALGQLGARAVLATTAVGAVDPGLPLGRPVIFEGDPDSAIAKWISEYDLGWVLRPENIAAVAEELASLSAPKQDLTVMRERCHRIYHDHVSKQAVLDRWDIELRSLIQKDETEQSPTSNACSR